MSSIHIEYNNITDFPVFGFKQYLFNNELHYTLIAKQTFDFSPKDQILSLSKEQRGFRFDDVYEGDPMVSAISLPNDLIPFKTHPEIMIIGHAHHHEHVTHWHTSLSDGKKLNKILRVSGPSDWEPSLTGEHTRTSILPINQILLSYQKAYGGHILFQDDEQKIPIAYPLNFSGSGWMGNPINIQLNSQAIQDFLELSIEKKRHQVIQAPQIEYMNDSISAPGVNVQPASFGPLPPTWEQRLAYCKNMKDISKNNKGMPKGFDPLFWQQAPKDQWLSEPLLENETTFNMLGFFSETPKFSFTIPPSHFAFYIEHTKTNNSFDPKTRFGGLKRDTILVDLDHHQIEIIWRALLTPDMLNQESLRITIAHSPT